MTAVMEGFVAGRQASFFGIGTKLDVDGLTAAKAIKEAKLNWEVELEPCYRKLKGDRKFEVVEGRHLIVRQDNGAVLGNVGKTYVPLQNRDAFAFVNTLIDGGDAHFVAAGALKGGKQVFMVAKFDEPWTMLAGEDPHDMYVILRNGHDGGRAVQELITPVRISCLNMMALASRSAQHRFSVVHNSSMEAKMEDAVTLLQRVEEYRTAYANIAETLAAKKIGDQAFRTVLDAVLPHRPKIEEVKEDIVQLRKSSSALEAHRGDRWGALNAVTEYFEHGRVDRGREGRLIDVADGYARQVRDRAVTALLP
jgi:phage/plasmid-like protein (TIGR03299 family)